MAPTADQPDHAQEPTAAAQVLATLRDYLAATRDLRLDGPVVLGAPGQRPDTPADLSPLRFHRRGDDTVATLPDGGSDVRAALAELASIGSLAGTVLNAAKSFEAAYAETRRDDDREARTTLYRTTTDPATFGLTAHPTDDDAWTLPDPTTLGRDVRVTRTTDVDYRWGGGARDAIYLNVHVDDVHLGHVALDGDGDARTEPRQRLLRLDHDTVGGHTVRELSGRNPWNDITLPDQAPLDRDGVATHVAFLAGVADQVSDWLREVTGWEEQVRDALETREAEAQEWARLSRSKDRLPTAVLNKWMQDTSHLTHRADGLATGGWKVAAELLAGRTRPRHLDAGGRRKRAVGVKEVLWVARLVHMDYRGHKRADHIRFYGSDLDTLREALPDCVVKMPEDGLAIYVAVDSPEHVEVLEAAVVEHVLLGGPATA